MGCGIVTLRAGLQRGVELILPFRMMEVIKLDVRTIGQQDGKIMR